MSVKVFIKEACGKITEIELSDAKYASYTVLQLKRDLRDKKIFTDRSQRLIFKWCHLDDDAAKLSHYRIQHESTVHLLDNHLTKNIVIKCLTGKIISFWLHEVELKSYLAEHLEIRIYEKEGIPEDQQRLIYSGQQLGNCCTLSGHGIQHKSTIHLVLRLRGGENAPAPAPAPAPWWSICRICGKKSKMGEKGTNRSMEVLFSF